jgi:hypothetical protein
MRHLVGTPTILRDGSYGDSRFRSGQLSVLQERLQFKTFGNAVQIRSWCVRCQTNPISLCRGARVKSMVNLVKCRPK